MKCATHCRKVILRLPLTLFGVPLSKTCQVYASKSSGLSRWTKFRELTVIKVLTASLIDPFKLELNIFDQMHGVFDANAYLASRSGPLLEKLRDPAYF